MIVQLPFDGVDVDEVLAAIKPEKDVDGLGPTPIFDPATPKGIIWILGAYDIDFKGKTVAVVGQGRLVGAPLSQMLEDSGANVIRCNSKSDLKAECLKSNIVVSAVGKPGLIGPGMVEPGTVVIDAGTADLGGSVVGDVDKALYDDETLKVTPNPGGVGPVTVSALFDNVILAAKKNRG
jgi:methylenetetrahydrofolate dehydrogenase (NADP+)/methenyltetrahydrofolate cyclohydrolase